MSTTAPTRKIAYVPTLAAYYSLPLAYDPALVTEEDAREDSRIELAEHALRRLAEHSADGMDDARNGEAEGTQRHEDASADGERLASLWAEAIDALSGGGGGAVHAARALAEAQRIAADWGDDADERRALAMLRAGAGD